MCKETFLFFLYVMRALVFCCLYRFSCSNNMYCAMVVLIMMARWCNERCFECYNVRFTLNAAWLLIYKFNESIKCALAVFIFAVTQYFPEMLPECIALVPSERHYFFFSFLFMYHDVSLLPIHNYQAAFSWEEKNAVEHSLFVLLFSLPLPFIVMLISCWVNQ